MKKIVLIGGGSRLWTPQLARDMLLKPFLSKAEYVLYDPDVRASKLVAAVLKKISEKIAPEAKVTVESDRVKAFTGADAFIITISTGGFDAMAHDLKIPEDYSIYHTVGDTSGPGGWARSLRNIPVFIEFAQDFNKYAPNAIVLNYTNPMTVLTQVLARLCKAPVVGLCHGLFENLEYFQKLFGLKSEKELSVRYAGLNHFFWVTEARAGSRDILAAFHKKLEKEDFSHLLKKVLKDPMGFSSDRNVADEVIRETGYCPFFADRHICEFFPQYITSLKTIKAYKLKRTTIVERRKNLRNKNAELQKWLKEGLPSAMFKRSRETAADILAAWFTGTPFVDVGNVPNIGQIDNLSRGIVVETPVLVDHNGFTPVSMGHLPQSVLPLVEPWVHVFNGTFEAGMNGNRKLALQALRNDPTCSHLSTPQVKELGERLLRASRQYTKYLR